MNCSLSNLPAKAMPSTFQFDSRNNSVSITASKHIRKPEETSSKGAYTKPKGLFCSLKASTLAAQAGAIIALVEQPAFAVTGVNYEEDFTWTFIQSGSLAFWYFLIMPPIILNWLRLRWYKRMLLEMYLQFMCVFLFFPGVLLWAPFINFRRLPQDPNMKYPWSTPQDPSLTDSQSPP